MSEELKNLAAEDVEHLDRFVSGYLVDRAGKSPSVTVAGDGVTWACKRIIQKKVKKK